MIACREIHSPVGPLVLAAEGGMLVGLSFRRKGKVESVLADTSDDEVLQRTEAQLAEYFAGARSAFDLPLELRGPECYLRVWNELLTIPYGETISYGELAQRVGSPAHARAVGAANGANPIAIVVPCHRVIGADGTLVGYGGGLRRKQMLLDLESKRLTLALN